jgi:hypothetical protein
MYETNRPSEPNGPLTLIVGRELSEVCFVLDYIQFGFDGPRLTAITDPVIGLDAVLSRPGALDYHGKLVGSIGKAVTEATVIRNEAVHIQFLDGWVLEISLKPEDYSGPEAVIFDTGTEIWVC